MHFPSVGFLQFMINFTTQIPPFYVYAMSNGKLKQTLPYTQPYTVSLFSVQQDLTRNEDFNCQVSYHCTFCSW